MKLTLNKVPVTNETGTLLKIVNAKESWRSGYCDQLRNEPLLNESQNYNCLNSDKGKGYHNHINYFLHCVKKYSLYFLPRE